MPDIDFFDLKKNKTKNCVQKEDFELNFRQLFRNFLRTLYSHNFFKIFFS